MLKEQSVLCFAPSDWWGMNPSCTVHLMKRLAIDNNKVLYVNPFSSDLLGMAKAKKKGICQRLLRKFKSLAKWLCKGDKNLYVFSPLFIPVQGKSWIDWVNNLSLCIQLKLVCFIVGIKKPVIWIENLRAADLLKYYKESYTLFHASDLFTHDGYVANKSILQQREQTTLNASHTVVCVSRELYAKYKNLHPSVHYLSHGVEFERFHEAVKENNVFGGIASIKKPIVGYFGTLTDSNDIGLWETCAQQYPNISFVFVGRITGGDYSALQSKKNVTFLGPQPYESIPAICAGFDLCMLAWKDSPWIRSCNPLKLFEYMASGKPVVSVAIEEIKQYADIVSVTETKEEFVEKISWELEHDTLQRKQKRIEIARQNDWQEKLKKLYAIIENDFVKRINNG